MGKLREKEGGGLQGGFASIKGGFAAPDDSTNNIINCTNTANCTQTTNNFHCSNTGACFM
jgi:hypothetical protein